MKKLSLNIDALRVQTFATGDVVADGVGTVHGLAKKTGLQDTNCSAIDACASARGCTEIDCETVYCDTYDANQCPSAVDACPSGRGCTVIDCTAL